MSIHQRILSRSQEKGLTLEELAKATGTGKSSLYEWRDHDSYPLRWLKKAATELDAPLSYLLQDELSPERDKEVRALEDHIATLKARIKDLEAQIAAQG